MRYSDGPYKVLKGGKYEWQPHLDAITSILRLYIPGIRFRSRRTSSESDNTVTSTSYISNNDEQNNGLEFLVINVLWFDILACVSAGREPHLPYKRWLDVIGLEMSDVMGCQSWVMSTIGDIAQLNIWKQEKAKARVLSIPQLTFRSQEIAERLENGIIKLENLEGVSMIQIKELIPFIYVQEITSC